MKSLVGKAFLYLLVILPAAAQPTFNSVVNAATNRARQFPFSSLAQGSLAVAYGANLGPAALEQVSRYPLATNLAGTSATITVGSTTVDALMIYTSAGQIAFVVPSNTPVGSGTVRASFNQQTSAPIPIEIVATNVGIYSWPQDGNGQAVATDGVTNRVVQLENPAKPGDVLNIWSNGVGAVQGDEAGRPLPGDLTGVSLEAWVGDKQAEILYRGRSGCCTALDQIVIKIPAGVPASCFVPIYFKNANFVSNMVTLPITADGSPCPEPLEHRGLNLVNKSQINLGTLILERLFDRGNSGAIDRFDFAHFFFVRYRQPFYNLFKGATAAPGTCFVNQFNNAAGPVTQEVALNAGSPLTLTIGSNTFQFPRSEFGDYGAFFQGFDPLDVSGNGSLSSRGGEIAAFNMSLETAALPNFQWNEHTTLSSIATGQPLALSWSGSDSTGFVNIIGTVGDRLGMAFYCRISGAESQFTIPAEVTRLMPAGSGSIAVNFEKPGAVGNRPADLDAFRYERRVMRSRSVTYR